MERENKKSLYDVYLTADKVFDTRNSDAAKIFNAIRSEYGLSELQDTGLPDWTDGYDITEYLTEHPELGYDAIVLDEGGDIVNGKPVSRGESIVIKDSTQVKSATDNIGTFDRSNGDIRNSVAMQDDDIGTMEQMTDEELLWQMRLEDAKDVGEREWLEQAKGRAEKLKDLRSQLAEAQRQMQTTNHELKTAGITKFAKEIALNVGIKNRGLQQQVREQLVDLYQNVLDTIDSGNDMKARDVLWNGAREVADWLIDNGYTSEKISYKWVTVSFASQYARTPEARASVRGDLSRQIIEDFSFNHARDAMPRTAADKLVQQTKDKYSGKLQETRREMMTAQAQNLVLEQQNKVLKEANSDFLDHKLYIDEFLGKKNAELAAAKKEIKNDSRISQRQQDKIAKLEQQLREAKAEAAAWQGKSKHASSVLQSALSSKSRDISTLQTENREMREKLENQRVLQTQIDRLTRQIDKYEKMLDGDLKNPKLNRLLKEARAKAADAMKQKKDAQMEKYRKGKEHTAENMQPKRTEIVILDW